MKVDTEKRYVNIYTRQHPTEVMKHLKATQKNFKFIQSGYVSKFKFQVNGFKKSIICGKISETNFKLANILKSEVLSCGIDLTDVNPNPIFYKRPDREIEPCEIYNVDITSAYLNALVNNHFIKKNGVAFKMLNNCKKSERLKSVGMLAKKDLIINYQNGEVFGETQTKFNEYTRKVFFILAQSIDNLMLELSSLKSFVFFWFDGAYFSNEKDANKAVKILKKHNYNSTFEVLTDFSCVRDKHNLSINYNKGDKTKSFLLPIFLKNIDL